MTQESTDQTPPARQIQTTHWWAGLGLLLASASITSADQLQEVSLTKPPGTTVAVEFLRDGQTHAADIVLS